MSIFRGLKNNIIYSPRIFYFLVYMYAWSIFGKDFKVNFPSKKIRSDSTHFLFILTDRKSGEKYMVKHRNKISDIYFQKHTKVKRLPNKEYLLLLEKISQNKYSKEIIPKTRIYKERVLWEYLEEAVSLRSPELNLSDAEIQNIRSKVDFAIDNLYKEGIIYGRVKSNHILIRKEEGSKSRVILVDWDTARYIDSN